ncbi:hypothetical protein OC846_002277, partial [Tilletia horrida]
SRGRGSGEPLTVDDFLSISTVLDATTALDDSAIVERVQNKHDDEEVEVVEDNDNMDLIEIESEQELLNHVTKLKVWCQFKGGEVGARSIHALHDLDKELRRVDLANRKQTTILNYFQPV